MDKRISIITVAYNSATTLRQTMDSVLRQEYTNYEYVVVDGGSTDNTVELLTSFEARFKNYANRCAAEGKAVPTFRWVSEPDNGMYDGLNKGIRMATGDVVGILHSDDFYRRTDIFGKINEAFAEDPDLEAVYGNVRFVRPDNLEKTVRYYSSRKWRPSLFRYGFMPAHPSFFEIRENFEKYGYYRTDYYIAADFDLLIRHLYLHRAKTKYLPIDFVVMRMGGRSTAGLRSKIVLNTETVRACRENGIWTCQPLLYMKYFSKIFEFANTQIQKDVQSKAFMELMLVALGNKDSINYYPLDEWVKAFYMSRNHRLEAFCFAAIQKMVAGKFEGFRHLGMSRKLYTAWMSAAFKVQSSVEQQMSFIARLAAIFRAEGLDMMLLKGYELNLLYPDPMQRNPGDVDFYLMGAAGDSMAWKRGDEAVMRELGVTISDASEHHTKFTWNGQYAENHYDFVNTRIRRSSKRLERVFKELAEDRSRSIEVQGQRVILPSDRLNALFLLRHTAGHFASEGICLRNVLDWGLFVCGTPGLEWDWLWQLAEEYNMHRFLMCLNAICIEDFGMDAAKFDQRHYDAALKARVLEEIMNGPDYLPRDVSVWKRTARWWNYRWRHRICYSDTMFSSFLSSVWANVNKTSH